MQKKTIIIAYNLQRNKQQNLQNRIYTKAISKINSSEQIFYSSKESK